MMQTEAIKVMVQKQFGIVPGTRNVTVTYKGTESDGTCQFEATLGGLEGGPDESYSLSVAIQRIK